MFDALCHNARYCPESNWRGSVCLVVVHVGVAEIDCDARGRLVPASSEEEARHFCGFGCSSCGRRPGSCNLACYHFAANNGAIEPKRRAAVALSQRKRLVARIRTSRKRRTMARLEPKFYGTACWDRFIVTFPPIFNGRQCDCVDPIPLEYVLGLERSAYDSGSEGIFFLFLHSLYFLKPFLIY